MLTTEKHIIRLDKPKLTNYGANFNHLDDKPLIAYLSEDKIYYFIPYKELIKHGANVDESLLEHRPDGYVAIYHRNVISISSKPHIKEIVI